MRVTVVDQSRWSTPAQKPLRIERASAASVYLELFDENRGALLGHATGFLLSYDGHLYLMTNRHVVTNRHPDTNSCLTPTGETPDHISMRLPLTSLRVGYASIHIDLYSDRREPLWMEHPAFGRKVDVVAIKLDEIQDDRILVAPHSLEVPSFLPITKMRIAQELLIVGFPFNISDSMLGYPVWTRASVASEPSIDYRGMPCFLVDARTREGQSGSPAIAHEGQAVSDTSQDFSFLYPAIDLLLGIYSGRTSETSDIGHVWTKTAMKSILDGKIRPSLEEVLTVPHRQA